MARRFGVPAATGLRFCVHDPEEYIQRQIILTGSYEPEISRLLIALLRPGELFLDVGANMGVHTLTALAIGARTIAFEPVPRIRMHLCENIGLNGLQKNAQVHELALSDRVGSATLYVASRVDDGSHSLIQGVPASQIDAICVQCVRLDDLLEQDPPDTNLVCKIDVEGAESLVLDGMSNTIVNHKPAILIETADRLAEQIGESAESVLERLTRAGYRLYRVSPGANGDPILTSPRGVSEVANHLAIHPESVFAQRLASATRECV